MNQLQPYEQLLADKLEQRPLPDLADAIWVNIEKGLDAEMPPDNGPSHPSPSPVPVAGWIKGAGGLIIVAVVIVAILIPRRRPADNKPSQPTIAVPASQQQRTDSQVPVMPFIRQNNLQQQANGTKKVDSSAGFPNTITLSPAHMDSAAITPPVTLSPSPDSAKLVPPASIPPSSVPPLPKKGKGVKLTDSDYKIVPIRKD